MKRTLKVSAALTASAVALVASAGAAHAARPVKAPAAAQAPRAAAGTAPSCVKRQIIGVAGGIAARVSNGCGKAMRVKVLVKRGKDSPCWRMQPNQKKLWIFVPQSSFPKYEKTVTC
ncbi:hypothetical protein [Planomonospora algeriensis]